MSLIPIAKEAFRLVYSLLSMETQLLTVALPEREVLNLCDLTGVLVLLQAAGFSQSLQNLWKYNILNFQALPLDMPFTRSVQRLGKLSGVLTPQYYPIWF